MFDFLIYEENLIRPMQWELSAASSLDVSVDLVRFMLCFFLSVPVGAGMRLCRTPTVRNIYSIITGIALIYYPFGGGIIHVFPVAILTYLAMWLAPHRAGTLAWFINFPYLIALHVAHASGVSWSLGKLDFTGGMMVLVLKTISAAVCYQDAKTLKKEVMNSYLQAHALYTLPSFLEWMSFIFGFGNLLAGPYVEITDYLDFIHERGLWDPHALKHMPFPYLPGLMQFLEALFILAAYMTCSARFNVSFIRSEWFYKQNIMMRWAAYYITGVTHQMKYVFAWKLAEAAFTFAGLNFNGWDDKGKPLWNRYCNVQFMLVQTADSGRKLPITWNILTGVFLRRYVYERVTPAGKKPGFQTLLIANVTSALWHGLFPGYLWFFVTLAVQFHCSTLLFKWENCGMIPPAVAKFPLYILLKILWTNGILDYVAMAFMLCTWDESIRIFNDVFWVPHLTLVVLTVIGFIIPPRKPKSKEPSKEE